MSKKICMITGANAGIGREAAVQIAQEGYRVVMVCRSDERGRAALADVKKRSGSRSVELMLADMSLEADVCALSCAYYEKYDKLDVLINNAAHFDISQKELSKTSEGVERIWATNHLGPVLLTEQLLPLLKEADGRIINIASQGLVMHPGLTVDIDDPEFERRKFSVPKAYYQSKLAQVMYTYWLAANLEGTGVCANCIRVTAVQIDLSRHPDLSRIERFAYEIKSKQSISPQKMAEEYTRLAVAQNMDGVTGKYFDHRGRPVKSGRYSMDEENIDRVMALTMDYIGC